MNDLKKALDNFWNWAQITSEEYKVGKGPSFPLPAEWEEQYPNWREIENEFQSAIEDLNQQWSEQLANFMIIAIALDNENGILMDHCVKKLHNLNKFVLDCIDSDFIYARLEIAFRIEELTIPKEIIDKLINDRSDLVRKIILNIDKFKNPSS